MRNLHSIILICLFLPSSISFGQSKLHNRGEKFLKNEKFDKAKDYFSDLDSSIITQDPFYDYYMGIIYSFSADEKEKGIPHLESYLQRVDSAHIEGYGHLHIYFILGKLYHLNYEFDEAEKCYSEFIQKLETTNSIPKRDIAGLIEHAKREIEHCSFGRIAIKNPRHVIIESLGDSINTKYPDYAAVVSQDEKTLFFTSRRPNTTGGKKDSDGSYFEDIYRAKLEKGSLFDAHKKDTIIKTQGYYFNIVTDFQYSEFESAGSVINSKSHDGSIQLSQNDSLLYFYNDYDIWYAEIHNTSLLEPKKMGTNVNSDNYEPSIFFSYDGEKLFIVSDRPGGYGGLDIYISEKDETDEWGPARNLGPNINTPYNEDAPYLDPDEETFYFSSDGHSSMGGYDIFRSKRIDTTYTTPVNIGFPINTPGEDIYFTMTKRYNRGYYSSDNLSGMGDMDIYRITFADERDPIAELKGFVKKGSKLLPAKSTITVTARDVDEKITTKSDTLTGDYFLLLGNGKVYDMYVETEGFAPYTHTFKIPEQQDYFQLYQEIHHIYLYNSDGKIIGQKITLFNALGEQDSTIAWYAFDEEIRLKLKKIGYILDYDGLITVDSDVKFYMTFDSLANAMEVDTNLVFDFHEGTTISYLKENSFPTLKMNSYGESDKSLPENITALSETSSGLSDSVGVGISEDVKYIEELFFTVQIGVFSQPVPASSLYNITPLNSQVTPAGNVRYSTGKFNSEQEAIRRRDEIIKIGILDAYVTSYYKGERLTVEEANNLIKLLGKKILKSE